MSPKVLFTIAIFFALFAAGTWLISLRPAAVRTTLGIIAKKTFKPAGTYWQYPVGADRSLRTATEIPIAEAYVFELSINGLQGPVFYSLNTVASREFETGQKSPNSLSATRPTVHLVADLCRENCGCRPGEAINGAGVYFGADLDGLNDCLRGGFGVVPPFTLRWLNPEVARGSLIRFLPANSGPLSFSTEQPHADRRNRNSGNELSLFEKIMSVLRDNHVTVEFE